MVAAAICSVVVANSPAYETVHAALELPVSVRIGSLGFDLSFESFVNDFLMAIFFLLVGIELKYEVTVGQLRRPRQAALPMLAAVGGVVVPSLIYFALNAGGAEHGWAVPMATDIAFALGVMSLLGDSVAPATKVFFSTLAIADDILAIVVIAIAYGQVPNAGWLLASVVVTGVLIAMNRYGIYYSRAYGLVGIVLWACMYNSGIHATLAGIILAFCLPARTDIRLESVGSWLGKQAQKLDDVYDEESHILGQHDFTATTARVERVMRHVTPPLQRVERAIAVPVNFLILPVFAFVNAQVRLVGVDVGGLMADPVTLGVYLGAVLGKPIGIVGVTLLLTKTGFARLPKGVGFEQVVGVGLMGGLGFTMSILIAGLAFTDPGEVLAAKFAIMAASITSGVLGCVFLAIAERVLKKGGPSADDRHARRGQTVPSRDSE